RLLVSTQTANKLIADVWFARADFAKDHPDVIEGLVRGIFDAMEALKGQSAKQEAAQLMATGYSIPATDALSMLGDAHSTNWPENTAILTKTVVIHFFPNSWDLHKKVISQVNGQDRETAYDPNVDFVVDEIGRLAGQYGAARIVIEGHTDASMKGQIDPAAVKELSTQRANAVKEAVLRRFRTLQPNQFLASGMGWDRPADPTDP